MSPTLIALIVLFSMAGMGVLALFGASWIVCPPGTELAARRLGACFNSNFMAFGVMAGTAGACAGGLLGLLFGLPTSAARAVAQSNAAPHAPGQDNPWFTDNTAMEQIADWLTKIIVGLSLVNFDKFILYGTAISIEIAKAMTGQQDAGPAIGGLTLAPSTLVGFAISYIWIRRYLPGELASARLAMIEQQQLSTNFLWMREKMEAAERAGAKQITGAAGDIPAKTEAAIAALEAQTARSPQGANWQSVITAGGDSQDPWKGQFGTHTPRSVLLDAVVKELPTDPNWFSVLIKITVVDEKAPADQLARLYLHPTFPNPIREIQLTRKGYAEELFAWGAFTIGLQLQSGELYELDLSQLPGAPAVFKAR